MNVIIPILILGILGFFFGISLAFSAKKFQVKADLRLEKIKTLLPGANCGACGAAGCLGFAEGLLEDKFNLDACRVMEDKVKEEIAKILGKTFKQQTKKIAVLHCKGGKKVKDKFIYQGINDCIASHLLLGGQKECFFGCLGLATCVKACPFGAIKMTEEGIPVIDENKCMACNKCVQICPQKLFSLVPQNSKVYVACSSHDLGKDTKAVCPVGCIACTLCVKACKFDAIHIVDNLAVIDYNKCTSCGECVKVCPTKCIIMSKVNVRSETSNKGEI